MTALVVAKTMYEMNDETESSAVSCCKKENKFQNKAVDWTHDISQHAEKLELTEM